MFDTIASTASFWVIPGYLTAISMQFNFKTVTARKNQLLEGDGIGEDT